MKGRTVKIKKLIFYILATAVLFSLAACVYKSDSGESATPYTFSTPDNSSEEDTSQSPPPETPQEADDAFTEDISGDTPDVYYLPVSVRDNEGTLLQKCEYDSNGALIKYTDYEYSMEITFAVSDNSDALVPLTINAIDFYNNETLISYSDCEYIISSGRFDSFCMSSIRAAEGYAGSNVRFSDITYSDNGVFLSANIAIVEDGEELLASIAQNNEEYFTLEVLDSDEAGRPLTRRAYWLDDGEAYYDETFQYDAQGKLRLYIHEYHHWIYEYIFDENGCISSYTCTHTPSGGFTACEFEYKAFPSTDFKGFMMDYASLIDREDINTMNRAVLTHQIPSIIRVWYLQERFNSFDFGEWIS